ASPVTQTFGLGLFQTVTPADLEKLEGFFRERGAPVFHEVCPLADAALLALLNERGYQPVEFTSVMFRRLGREVSLPARRNERIEVRLVREGEQELWAQTGARGWGASGELADFLQGIGRVNAARPDAHFFLAELDGQPIAAGALSMAGGVALLAGASTV